MEEKHIYAALFSQRTLCLVRVVELASVHHVQLMPFIHDNPWSKEGVTYALKNMVEMELRDFPSIEHVLDRIRKEHEWPSDVYAPDIEFEAQHIGVTLHFG